MKCFSHSFYYRIKCFLSRLIDEEYLPILVFIFYTKCSSVVLFEVPSARYNLYIAFVQSEVFIHALWLDVGEVLYSEVLYLYEFGAFLFCILVYVFCDHTSIDFLLPGYFFEEFEFSCGLLAFYLLFGWPHIRDIIKLIM